MRRHDWSLLLALFLVQGFSRAAQVPPVAPKPELVLQVGHSGSVSAVAFSPNGKWLASASADNTVKLWEVATGRELRTLLGHTLQVDNVAFSPDGRWLVSGSFDKTIKLWEVESGRELRTLRGHTDIVFAVAFSPDGKWLASSGNDKSVRLWDPGTGQELRVLTGHSDRVGDVVFSPDGRYLASGSADKTIRLWDPATGQEIRTFTGNAGLRTIAFGPDGKSLASGHYDGKLKIWDVARGLEPRNLGGHADQIGYVAFSPDGKWLASGSYDKTIKLWDTATGRETRRLSGHASNIGAVAFSPDGRLLASGSWDHTVRLWEPATGQLVRVLPGYVDTVMAVANTPDGRWLMSFMQGNPTAARGAAIKLWEVAAGKYVDIPLPKEPPIFGKGNPLELLAQRLVSLGISPLGISVGPVAVSPGWRLMAFSQQAPGVGPPTNHVAVWELDSGTTRTLSGHSEPVHAISFSPDAQFLATGSEDMTIRIWDATTGVELRSLACCAGKVWDLTFSPDGRRLASASGTTVRVWEIATGRELRAFTAHGKWIVRSVSFSPDGRRLASTAWDRTVRIWDLETGQELKLIRQYTEYAARLSFSADGRYLLGASGDGSIRIWDAASGEEAAFLIALADGSDWAVVTPEGLFDGSEQAVQKLVTWRIRNRMYPSDRFFADYYTPGLLARILGGEKPKPRIDLASLNLPPEVRIVAPRGAARMQRAQAVVSVEATDLGGGIAEVRVYQNGKFVNGHSGATPSGKYTFEIDLVPGENILRAVALSKQRVESNDDTVRVVLDAPESSKPALHLLVVGINRYEDPSFNLNFARQDGEAIARFFEQRGAGLFGSVKVLRLFDGAATRAAIRQALDQLTERVQRDDVVLLYLAGHGVGVGQQYYFLPHEMRKEEDETAAIRKYGISAFTLADAMSRLPALKIALILDTCQSEVALQLLAKVTFRGLGAAEERAAKMLARAAGIHLVAAATKQQYAAEVPQLGHGILTYALLSGLGEKGEPEALAPGGDMVTISSLWTYVNQKVQELTEKYHEGAKQYPVTYSTGMDFPLLVRK